MKKILFLVRSTNPFKTQRRDTDYIISELIKKGYKVDIYDPNQKLLYKLKEKETISYNIFPKAFFKNKLYILLNLLCLIRFVLKNKNKYDIVQINYIRDEYLLIPRIIKNMGKSLVLFLFGDDINDRNFFKNNFKKIYNLASEIIVTNVDFGNHANEMVGLDIVKSKLNIMMLPQDHFKFYRNFTYENKIDSKKKLNFPTDKIILTIGTNSTPNEQHEKIFEELKNIENKELYHFVLNISNRFNTITDREEFLKNEFKKHFRDTSYTINQNFLSFEEVATIRHATDIFINLRRIDQLAASMLESNIAYSHVITGSWLPYNDYIQSVNVEIIDTFKELKVNIEDLSARLPESKPALIQNKKNVLSKYDNNVITEWVNFYDSKFNTNC
jgi:hypothetical protein